MKAFIVKKYGKKEKLHLANVAEPNLAQNEVLVEIHAAAVNVLDSKIRSGEFKLILPYKTPFVLGHDVAGVVTKVGSMVSKFKVGDEVYSRPSDNHIGTFAERIAINEKDVALKPNNLSMAEAASIPLVGITAWQVLVETANLKKGQKVFIQAGSGGVGTFAIQLAKHLGATVATTTSSTNFDYKKEDFETKIKDYDVVINSQDTKTLEKSLNVLKPSGKIISISGPPTKKFAVAIGAPWYIKILLSLLSLGIIKKAKKRGVSYSFLFMRAEGNQLSKITALINSGAIKPVIDKVFSFEQTNDAMAYVESGRAKGKVIIKVK